MTLHFFGSIDGALISISDGRTTADFPNEQRVLCDSTTKAFTYPLSAEAGSWIPGAFGAVVLVQDRAYFPDGSGGRIDVSTLLKDLINACPDATFSSAAELGEALWRVIFAEWYQCAACTQERSDMDVANAASLQLNGESHPFYDASGEYKCDKHETSINLTVLGVSAAGTDMYRRIWAESEESHPLYDRVIISTVDEASSISIDPHLTLLADADTIFTRLNNEFRQVAVKDMKSWTEIYNGTQQPGSIGGNVHSFIVAPQTGIVTLPIWFLDPSTSHSY